MATNVENLADKEIQGWLLRREVGRGADGIVYAAERGSRQAAVKIFFPDILKKNGVATARERLDLQLSLAGKRHHPNLVEIYEGGEDADLGTLFIVMELVPGNSLDRITGKIPAEKIPALASQLASAAEYLETQELFHRDIKPANIIISDNFEHLTLLDLGIVYRIPEAEDDKAEQSGDEFVATLRYSPPEFVWRTEERELEHAWRAVTFYQIGATLHDMVMGVPLFSGFDKPRAVLYDSVRDRTPTIAMDKTVDWLIQTIHACLLKDWRQRAQLVTWGAFAAPPSTADVAIRERRIRLRQLRNEEVKRAEAKVMQKSSNGPTREQELWQLNQTLSLEIRTYLQQMDIFPKCQISEDKLSERSYALTIKFENDDALGFPKEVIFTVNLSVDATIASATRLSFNASIATAEIESATWTEMFNVTTAFSTCQQTFLSTVEKMLSIQ